MLIPVTLHVSVWVEIYKIIFRNFKSIVTLHVSVWVEMQKSTRFLLCRESRSTWACELKFDIVDHFYTLNRSRSTWACELKYPWLLRYVRYCQVTLHVSVWVEICWKLCQSSKSRSRSTWACELKLPITSTSKFTADVTLHVSVWVEIYRQH